MIVSRCIDFNLPRSYIPPLTKTGRDTFEPREEPYSPNCFSTCTGPDEERIAEMIRLHGLERTFLMDS